MDCLERIEKCKIEWDTGSIEVKGEHITISMKPLFYSEGYYKIRVLIALKHGTIELIRPHTKDRSNLDRYMVLVSCGNGGFDKFVKEIEDKKEELEKELSELVEKAIASLVMLKI